jgi:hypothetical protein
MPVVPASVPPATGTAAPTNQSMEKIVTAFRNVDWKQLGADLKTFGERFAASDFAKIHPKPHEMPAVSAFAPRMGALIVWRRALLTLACIFSVILLVKTCFDPHTLGGAIEQENLKTWMKTNPKATADEIKLAKTQIHEQRNQLVQNLGETNVGIFDGLITGLWLCLFVSLAFLVLAAKDWRDWRKSRKWAVIAVCAILLPQLLAMIIPWGSFMTFKHMEAQGADAVKSAKLGTQIIVLFYVLQIALPFFYGMVNGVLRASLSAKTLIPASIVCGWGSMLLAITIAVPWFVIFSVVDQLELDAVVILGVFCLLAAPLSIIFRSRKLGLPLTPEEATPLVKRTKLVLTSLNVVGMAMILAYLSDKDLISATDILTLIVHYLANLMMVQVVAVDLLVLLLDRAHRKLAADSQPGEPLRQLGEVLQTAA